MSKNRIANTKNPFQGDRTKTLCVCSAGLLRSPTLAYVLQQPPYNRNTRAVGASVEFALIPIDEALIEWAEEIVFVERSVFDAVNLGYNLENKSLTVLKIPDKYEAFSLDLIEAIKDELGLVKFK
jgi:predicted protein tyrosine phosphatase